MKVKCFMVDQWSDLWHEGGGNNVGAMNGRVGAMARDGEQLCVMTPAGLVNITQAGKPGGWTVTGEAPNITMHPSLNVGEGSDDHWHGWLRDGVLTDA